MVSPFEYDGVLTDWKRDTVLRLIQGLSVLDVGCHRGDLVGFLREKEYYAYGYDTNLRDARQRHGPYFFDSLPVRRFDTVICWNTLEHVKRDKKFLDDILKLTRERLILCVPRQDEISQTGLTYRPYVDLTHENYYTEEKLVRMIPENYEVKSHKTTRIRPAMVYTTIGIPRIVCNLIDKILWASAQRSKIFYPDILLTIDETISR